MPAANNTVQWSDGTTQALHRRERPQVLVDAHGDVEVLYNGACCQGEMDDEMSYTLAVPTAAATERWGRA